MIVTKLYLYDSSQEANGYHGEDLSKYVLIGDTDVDDLTEVLDVVNLTIAGYPSGKEFQPNTKFIYQKWNSETEELNNQSQLWKEWHLCVSEDLVEQPIMSDNSYFNHHITFNEASVVAQKRPVDNMSVTYKLKDVSLDRKYSFDINQKAKVTLQNVLWVPNEDFFSGFDWSATWRGERYGRQFFWKFPNWFTGDEEQFNSDITDWTNFDYYQSIDPTIGYKDVILPIPMLEIWDGIFNTKTFEKMGFCSLQVKIIETDISTNNSTTINSFIVNPTSTNSTENYWGGNTATNTQGFITNRWFLPSGAFTPTATVYVKKISNYDNSPKNRYASIRVYPNRIYKLSIEVYNFVNITNFPALLNSVYDNNPIAYYTNSWRQSYLVYTNSGNTYSYVNNQYPLAEISFMTYIEGETGEILWKSAPEENAYNLFQKAQLNSQNVQKINGTNILETPQTFYLQEVDKQQLQNTRIVENFYNQKNLWEIMLEVGKYIHSIPKVKFGADDKFVVEWRKLGDTTQNLDGANKLTIFNSRRIEDYISACSSYISNMVQLGGIIDEWVPLKSTSDDYLVYNDVAEIITSKNIIEIVKMEIKCINNFSSYNISPDDPTRNLTGQGTHNEGSNGFVFEKNVYDLFDIYANIEPNKGLAIYYELGTNKIQGLNYRLPTINTGEADNDYAMKRIIGRVYGIDVGAWANIIINDFIFHIVYRTKDTVRSDQTRPDLRKYMLVSKYDRVPQHNQFNNQTDIVVDSVKFGNNIYGKLIRTGNSTYIVREWVDNLFSLKTAGYLYIINNEWYYASKVTNTYYKDHIISEIEYSKDYNQLSEIIGIPSEPRFYEISEQNLTQRETAINDYLVLGTKIVSQQNPLSFIRNSGWTYIANLIIGNETEFPKYGIAIFKNDKDRLYGNVIGNEDFYAEVCHPISTYSSQNTLTLEWDMVDNFSAGDKVSQTTLSINPEDTINTAYNTLLPVRYVDAFGRSDLLDFIILQDFGEFGLTPERILSLPESPIRTQFPNIVYIGTYNVSVLPTDEQLNTFVYDTKGRQPEANDVVIVALTETIEGKSTITNYAYTFNGTQWTGNITNNPYAYSKPSINDYADQYLFGNELLENLGDHAHGLGLIKDNREQISINYNIQMLVDSDRFVLSAYLWQPAKTELKIALLTEEVSKIINETIDSRIVMPDYLFDFTYLTDETNGTITIQIENALNGLTADQWTQLNVSAIAIISTDQTTLNGEYYFVMSRNVSDLSYEDAIQNWYISNYSKDIFEQQ